MLVVQTNEFTKCLRELIKKGKKGKDAIRKARAAMAECASEGTITDLSRTKHGESRLQHVEKFDLGDGYRLVTQIVGETRAFLYVGDHEDEEAWLERHKNYKWVKRESDSTLDFVQVTKSSPQSPRIVEANLDLPETLLDIPLLKDFKAADWKQIGFSAQLVSYLQSITVSRWEEDAQGIINHVESIANTDIAYFVIDLFDHAHRGEQAQLHLRSELASSKATIASESEASNAMRSIVNSEKFVTWQETEFIKENSTWADWLLFLHKEQKEFVTKEFNGPARLRGVSGSGKTCVLVHRARNLALRYPHQIVLALSLTESTRRLLDTLADELCGVERGFLKTSTMFALAEEFVERLAPNGLQTFRRASQASKTIALRAAEQALLEAAAAMQVSAFDMELSQRFKFLRDELDYIRTRLLPSEYSNYSKMKRVGRGTPLPESARPPVLAALDAYDKSFQSQNVRDHESTLQYALELAIHSEGGLVSDCRCILVDEVQDLSQIEIRILAQLIDKEGTRLSSLADGIFLCGDGAQSVYKRGFSLKHSGISVANRSYVLKKNYRNTREILTAAFGLISSYEYADVDEDQICSPTSPDYSVRRGERPYIIKCRSQNDEARFVVETIQSIRGDYQLMNDECDASDLPELPICVIGFNQNDRNRITDALVNAGIPTASLRDDIDWNSPCVKVSTVESAKGHEFQAVFIIGLCQGTMPHAEELENEWKREAARLYVAMTRARDNLYLSYSLEANLTPSVFLLDLVPNCTEMEFRNGLLRALPYSGYKA
jgi:superfamily I DNA/RNA helicase